MRIALLQHDIVWEDPAANHQQVAVHLERAARGGAELVVLPEMFATGFSMAAERVAEPTDGPTRRFLAAAARDLNLGILAGIAVHSAEGRPRNCAVFLGPDGACFSQTKLHPFSGADEGRYFEPGGAVGTFQFRGLRVTPFICYDLRFPEIFRVAADHTDLFVVIASWPARRRAHWRPLLLARAIENQAYVAGVNRIGEGGGLSYAGDTVLYDPWGEALLSPEPEVESLGFAEVDPARVAEVRGSFPALKDRRPEAYRVEGAPPRPSAP